jgi:DNA-binding NtrC family response regulator
VLLHPALCAPADTPLAGAALGDRQRIAVLLQAAALLSHLHAAGWHLVGELASGSVRDGERLCGLRAEPGAGRASARAGGAGEHTRRQLLSLLGTLFGPGEPVGRGEGRRAARELRERWGGGGLVPLPPDQAVADVLAAAPFLWGPRFAAARRALAAGWQAEGASGAAPSAVSPRLAGPEAVRRRLLAGAATLADLEELLAGERARADWTAAEGAAAPGSTSRSAEPAEGLDSAAARALVDEGRRRAAHDLLAGEAEAALAALLDVLRRCRRTLAPADAALLWGDVANARLGAGQLAGAERAAAHAALLLSRGEDPAPGRRALRRLLELRLRRGRVEGAEAALRRLAFEARGGRVDTAGDAALRARLDLVRGRARAAHAICVAALAELADGGEPAADELRVLAARALGWLGRADEARAQLHAADAPGRWVEAEEQPALWAHAGERERALATADRASCHHLWEAVLAGSHPARGRWSELEILEPYRAARLVVDFEQLTPGLVPVPWVRRAIATLRRLSADELAARLEGRLTGPWEALSAHLAESTHDEDGLQRLFAAAGADRAWVAVRSARGEQVLLAGPGGEEELVAPFGDGHLVLRAPRLDPIVKTLFRLLLRQLPAVRAAAAGQPVPGIVGESPALLSALARLPRLAHGEVPVMVLGESGTGKELVARQVHRLSARASGIFLPINCAALSESLLLSDLFGHARGAFTGADRDHAGIFESARGGTVFLDEIGDLPLAAQGKLLRVLQEKEVRRLGESTPRKVDVRVVTATHRDLGAMVREGSFREDLFYRLRVAVLELPPLRERGNDVLLLADHFLARASRGKRPARLSRAARARLLAHRWPGNVRELENVLEVAATLADGHAIEPEHLPLPAEPAHAEGSYHQQVESYRRRLVEDALVAAHGNRAEAARRLGLTRQALSYLVKQLRIDSPVKR